jgi:hypothetical protein
MDLKSPLFDRIRIKPRKAEDAGSTTDAPLCEHPGCKEPGQYRAPKGRGAEGQYYRFCLTHVREYNAKYNYFNGMADDAVAAFHKDSLTGHRPTWEMGVKRGAAAKQRPDARVARDWEYADPLGILRGEGMAEKRARPEPPRPRLSAPVLKALDILGLDETADATTIKATYKNLVKRFHPDAHGGDRSFEERLRDIIRAHDTLKAAGLC